MNQTDQNDQLAQREVMRAALAEVIQILGNQAALASALGVSRASISNWIKRGCVPPERAIALEELVQRKVTRQRLRPDFYPPKASVRRGRPPHRPHVASAA